MKRVMIGRLYQETHGFHPRPIPADEIPIVRNQELLSEVRGTGSILGGAVDYLASQEDILLEPVSDIQLPPGGPMPHEFYVGERDYWVERIVAYRPDAIFLGLHGAMSTTETADAEGDFLTHLRRAAGEYAVIGCGLDLHAHLTPAMLENADICIACKENPHTDFRATGEKSAQLTVDVLNGELAPVYVMAKARALYTGKLETTVDPLKDMHARAREIELTNQKIVDVSLCNTYRFMDAEDMGEVALVLSDGPCGVSEKIAMEFAREFWDRREEFVDDYLSIAESLDAIASRRAEATLPVALADMGDRTLAGAPGDSTLILQSALSHTCQFRAAMTVTDPETVDAARRIGKGGRAVFQLGGKITPQFKPFEVSAVVKSLHDDDIRIRGPVLGGLLADIGQSAVIEVDGRIQILVTRRAGRIHDPNIYEQRGIPIADMDFVVVKSGSHFTANFKNIASPMFVGSDGIGHYTPGIFPRVRSRVWPEHDVSKDPIIGPRTFARLSRASPNSRGWGQ